MVEVVDVLGRRIRVLEPPSLMEAGRHEFGWDGRSDAGSLGGVGVYFARVVAGHDSRVLKFVRLR